MYVFKLKKLICKANEFLRQNRAEVQRLCFKEDSPFILEFWGSLIAKKQV